MTSEQRCGTCRWADWMSWPGQINCIAPRPDSDRYETRMLMSPVDDGTTCPCYQPALPTQQPEECPDAD